MILIEGDINLILKNIQSMQKEDYAKTCMDYARICSKHAQSTKSYICMYVNRNTIHNKNHT